ncbi:MULTISPECIES: RHS repeat-associated core domain-containing protein [Photorhabdus]|nr:MULTISPECIES: RHS repeat-associated core domain-containing protein [Photorhabdus]AWK42195.1 hypothetical protein A4R40_12165 [Photorhabdus laumondii subsp. laumondii]MCC8384666.1 hypothetical protein [Photorhabdus laumondii]MCC8389038.1 hypothetical protein [Photorhabdus laumondii]MCC8413361.1 hypothetical protein [Photorhabdus laumondii]
MELLHHSQATNFTGAMMGGVDPRTGLFTPQIPITQLGGNDLWGPDLAITLTYNPLTYLNTGYGLGFSDNFTRYDTQTQVLTLATGEIYHRVEKANEVVDGQAWTFHHAKPAHFKVKKEKDAFWVLYKTGSREKLTQLDRANPVAVVSEIYAPSGHKLCVKWNSFVNHNYNYWQLMEVCDAMETLLKADLATTEKIEFTVWPGSPESYTVTLNMTNDLLQTVISASELTWHLEYETEGAHKNILTKVTTPSGLIEKVVYHETGHTLPTPKCIQYYPNAWGPGIIRQDPKSSTTATVEHFPYVTQHHIIAGSGSPDQVIRYVFSPENFLGQKNKNMKDPIPLPQQDNAYLANSEYKYTSTEVREYNEKRYCIHREYNKFHLLVSETETVEVTPSRPQKLKETIIKYYADVGKSFDDNKQPPQFLMPNTVETIWHNPESSASTTQRRKETTQWEYNAQCNLISMTLPDNTTTKTTYYAPDGEETTDTHCPAEPNGFERFIKEIAVEAPSPLTKTKITILRKVTYNYKSYDTYSPPKNNQASVVKSMVLPLSETHYSRRDCCADHLEKVKINTVSFYENTQNAFLNGRVEQRNSYLFENGNQTRSYTEDYSWSNENKNGASCIKCKTTGSGKCGTPPVSHEQYWSRSTGRLIFQKDAQDNNTVFQYDTIGHLISSTINADTAYEKTVKYAWSYSNKRVTVTQTDIHENRYITEMDGLGRPLKKSYSPAGYQGKQFDMERYQYNPLGQLCQAISCDHMLFENKSEKKCSSMTVSLEYDDWGHNSRLRYSDGTSVKNTFDPIKMTSEHQRVSNDESQSSGIIRTTYNQFGQITATERLTTSRIQQGCWHYLRDELGRLVSINANGNTTLLAYDAFDRVIKQTFADGTTISMAYENGVSVRMSATPLGINQTPVILGTQILDGLGRVIDMESGGRKIKLDYEGASPVPDTVTYVKGPTSGDKDIVLHYEYEPKLNNAVTKITAGQDDVDQTFKYDPKTGLLTEAIEEYKNKNDEMISSKLIFDYTLSGQLASEKLVSYNKNNRAYMHFKTCYSFSFANRPTAIKSTINGPRYIINKYSYDNQGRLETVRNNDIEINLKYDKLSRHVCQSTEYLFDTINNKITTSLTLDDFGRETKRTIRRHNGLKNNKGITDIHISQTFNEQDKITNKELLHGTKQISKEVYTYHKRGGLETYTLMELVGEREITQCSDYKYDHLGNITQHSITTEGKTITSTYTYGNGNIQDPCQLIDVSTCTGNNSSSSLRFTYNQRGALVCENDENNTKIRTWTYDSLGRIDTTVDALHKVETRYLFDATNRLIIKRSEKNGTPYHHDLSYCSNSLVHDNYFYGEKRDNAADRKYNKVGGICLGFSQTPCHQTPTSVASRYTETATDGKGSVIATFQGEDVQHIAYSPWGVTTEQAMVTAGQQPPHNTAIEEPRFNGEQWDTASASYLLGNGYRAYRPDLMRFTAPDSWSPFGAGGINAYAYCGGDPVNLNDPSGHISGWGWANIITGGIGLLLAPFTYGGSLELGLGVNAARGLTALDAASGVTAIASGALENKNPETSRRLGWMSLGLGLPSMVIGGYSLAQWVNVRLTNSFRTPYHYPTSLGEVNLSRKSSDWVNARRSLNSGENWHSEVGLNGRTIWGSDTKIRGLDIKYPLEQISRRPSNGDIVLLSGSHGVQNGDNWLINGSRRGSLLHFPFFKSDMTVYGGSWKGRTVHVRNLATMSEIDFGTLLNNGNSHIILGYCYGRNDQALRYHRNLLSVTSYIHN